MNNRPRELGTIQRWMQSVIMHPGGIAAGVASAQAQAQIEIAPAEIEQVIERSQKCTSIERLEVYGNAYFARLLECLRGEFPALLHALGKETFDAFAFAYLQQHPSQSYTLGELGGRFPQYLRDTRPPRNQGADAPRSPSTFNSQLSPDWADFLIHLAMLERTYAEVFDGPGVENVPLMSPDELRAVPPEHWPDARLVVVPCLRLLALSFPVHEYATAVRQGKEVDIPAAEPTWLAITRREYVVRRCPLSEPQYELLRALVSGETVGGAISAVAAKEETDLDQFAESLENWFRTWAAAGYFQRVDLAPR
jgi:hypothetical protein